MAGSRTLKLSILADVDDLKKQLQGGAKETENFGSKVGDVAKKAALAFAAVAAAAAAMGAKIAKDGIKAAMEDEKSFRKLELTLKNVTAATEGQIAAVEKYIAKTELRVGVEDNILRPAFARLIRSTKDAQQAQELMNLALDISAATGKGLDPVVAALGKAYDGNSASLGRLGLGIDSATLKSGDLNAITGALQMRFKGFADNEANTLEGRFNRLKIAMANAQEEIGYALLPVMEKFTGFLVNTGIPKLQDLTSTVTGKLKPVIENLEVFFRERLLPIFQKFWAFLVNDYIPAIRNFLAPIIEAIQKAFGRLTSAVMANKDTFDALFKALAVIWDFLQKYLIPILSFAFKNALNTLGIVASGAIKVILPVVEVVAKAVSGILTVIDKTIEKIKNLINTAINGLNTLINAVNKLPGVNIGTIGNIGSGGSSSVSSGSTGFTGIVPGVTPIPSVPTSGGKTVSPVTNNITVNGALDSESTARQIAKVLTESADRGTGSGGGALLMTAAF
jgi:hypothetical protein